MIIINNLSGYIPRLNIMYLKCSKTYCYIIKERQRERERERDRESERERERQRERERERKGKRAYTKF